MGIDRTTARRNAVLNGLNEADLDRLLPDLRPTPLPLGLVLHEVGQPFRAVHFPLVGVVSIVAELGNDQIAETATVGREGIVGIAAFLGARAPTDRSAVQVAGQALSMSADDFSTHINLMDGPLTAMLRRSAHALLIQVSRNAACNGVHAVRQRAARWLLMTADRMDSPRFDLTQQFLAQMLAVRRTSVSEVARALAEDGCITYTRGSITITDRARLQSNACDCYDVIRRATDEVLTT